MIRSTLVLAAALGAMTLASCDDYRAEPSDEAPAMEVAPAEEAPAEPVVAPEVKDETPTPPPTDALPEDQRSSQESVQPDSETLFY
jgi:PBP1b-binding outer membrane lipoprotein LpoB